MRICNLQMNPYQNLHFYEKQLRLQKYILIIAKNFPDEAICPWMQSVQLTLRFTCVPEAQPLLDVYNKLNSCNYASEKITCSYPTQEIKEIMTHLSKEAVIVRSAWKQKAWNADAAFIPFCPRKETADWAAYDINYDTAWSWPGWRQSLAETPHRIAKMYVDEIFSGLDYGSFPKITLMTRWVLMRW